MRNILLAALVITLAAPSNLFPGGEFNNWYFGNGRGITFNTADGAPAPLAGNAGSSWEGCFTMSDKNGKLLFYIDGNTIYNRNHDPMPGNFGAFESGGKSSTQSCIAVKKPGSDNIYYIVTAGESETSDNRKARLWTLDMNRDNGLGSLIGGNTVLFSGQSERLAVCSHANGKDVWLAAAHISPGRRLYYRIYGITESGFDIAGARITESAQGSAWEFGQLKFSADGRYMASAGFDEDFDIAGFDNATGELHDIYRIDTKGRVKTSYGIEFSYDSKKLYVSTPPYLSGNNIVYQFDISEYDKTKIEQSAKPVLKGGLQYELYGMQLAPDKKIYIISCVTCNSCLSIENPDEPGDKLVIKTHTLNGIPDVSYNFPTPPLHWEGKQIRMIDVSVSVPDTVVPTGSELCLPVRIMLEGRTEADSLPDTLDLSFIVEYDPKVFLPDESMYEIISDTLVAHDLRRTGIRVKNTVPDETGVLEISLCGHTYLTDTLATSVAVSALEMEDKGTVTYDNGSVTLRHCMDNLTLLLFKPFLPVKTDISQAGGFVTVSIETAEEGETSVEIFDLLGNSVYSASFVKSGSGYSAHELAVGHESAAGAYLVRVTSGRQTLSRPIVLGP